MKKCLLAAFIWATGTAAIHAQVTQISANKNLEFVGLAGPTKGIFSSSTDNKLYVSDGTAAGTTLLSSSITYEQACGVLGNKVLFKGTSAATGSELFITDGTSAGTTLVKDINAGTVGSQIGTEAVLFNGFVYFPAVTAAEGREIWKSNGTTAGTTLLKDIVAGTGNSNTADNYNLFSTDSYLLFSARTGTNGYELWKSDGTTAGTALLSDINTGAGSSNASGFYKLGNTVLFQAETATTGVELWKTDGTTGGTALVKGINPGPTGSASMFGTYFYEFNGRAYFDADNGTNGDEVWYTDGTAANTNILKDIEPGATGSFNFLINAVKVGNKFIFASGDLAGTRAQLWQSDGTATGTTVLKDFSAGSQIPIVLPAYDITATSAVQQLYQGKFFFAASTPAAGLELWVSDGSAANTVLVKDINAGAGDGLDNLSYQYTADAFYFAANNGTNGTELWKTNGTTNGTILVADINLGTGSSNPEIWPVFNNKLTLSANDGDNAATDLYVLNGTINPLPIKLTEFTAALIGTDASLRWTTSQEVNSDQFKVQRSLDGITFQNVSVAKAAGNSTSKQAYSFIDADIAQYGKQTIYYRLQAVDKDGKTELTKVVMLNLSAGQWNVKLMNNPISSTLQLSIAGATEKTTLRITDITGKSYYSTTVTGSRIIHIPVDHLVAGMYFITAENSQGKKTNRFVKN